MRNPIGTAARASESTQLSEPVIAVFTASVDDSRLTAKIMAATIAPKRTGHSTRRIGAVALVKRRITRITMIRASATERKLSQRSMLASSHGADHTRNGLTQSQPTGV